MEFLLLGRFEVIEGEEPIALGARPRAVLGALALHAGEAVSLGNLADAVWGSDPPASAARLLRGYVAQIRRALPAERVLTQAPGYALLVEPGELDSLRFEALLADGRAALAAGDARRARALCTQALELWRGAALADLALEPFAVDEAARLDDLRVACRECRSEADIQLGRHAEVIAELEALVAERPLREHARGLLMLALARAGRRDEALSCYRAARGAPLAELGLEPGPELQALERRISEGDPALSGGPAPADPRIAIGLPAAPTVGRRRELAELGRLLVNPGTRLVTLAGPAGAGKSHLAREVALGLERELANGAIVVDLGSLDDPEQLLPSIGRALGLRETAGLPWPDLLANRLRALQLLLVLDNVEHLLAGVGPLPALLTRARRLTVLATSRTALGLPPEQVVELPALERSSAVELFALHAVAAGAPVAAIAEQSNEIGQLCDRLGDLPLAIELTAPWLRRTPAGELLRQLDLHRTSEAPTLHRMTRAAIDSSLERLGPGAQPLLGRLAAFTGGFTAEAVAFACGSRAVAQLAALADAGLVQVRNGRHRLLESVRDHAAELPGAGEDARRLHAHAFVALAERAERELAGAEQAAWLERLESERDNLRAALEWLAEAGETTRELSLVAALERFWCIRGDVSEGRRRLQEAAEREPGGSAGAVAKALRTASVLALVQGDAAPARALAERALALYRTLDDHAGTGRCLCSLGATFHAQGNLAGAADTLDTCIRSAELRGDEQLMALARGYRGDVALAQGESATAIEHYERSLASHRATGDAANVARMLARLATVAVERGRIEAARALLRETIALSGELGNSEEVARSLIGVAAVARASGHPRDGALLLGAATAQLGELPEPTRVLEERTRAALRAAIGESLFEDAVADGARLTLSEAVALAHGSTVDLPAAA